jgi:hypothetical protein
VVNHNEVQVFIQNHLSVEVALCEWPEPIDVYHEEQSVEIECCNRKKGVLKENHYACSQDQFMQGLDEDGQDCDKFAYSFDIDFLQECAIFVH